MRDVPVNDLYLMMKRLSSFFMVIYVIVLFIILFLLTVCYSVITYAKPIHNTMFNVTVIAIITLIIYLFILLSIPILYIIITTIYNLNGIAIIDHISLYFISHSCVVGKVNAESFLVTYSRVGYTIYCGNVSYLISRSELYNVLNVPVCESTTEYNAAINEKLSSIVCESL